jgi:hypothetical protein
VGDDGRLLINELSKFCNSQMFYGGNISVNRYRSSCWMLAETVNGKRMNDGDEEKKEEVSKKLSSFTELKKIEMEKEGKENLREKLII